MSSSGSTLYTAPNKVFHKGRSHLTNLLAILDEVNPRVDECRPFEVRCLHLGTAVDSPAADVAHNL